MVVGLKHAGSDESRMESRSPEPVGNSVVNPDPFWIRIQEHSGPEFGSVSEYKIYSITLDRDPNSMYLVTTTLIGKRHWHHDRIHRPNTWSPFRHG